VGEAAGEGIVLRRLFLCWTGNLLCNLQTPTFVIPAKGAQRPRAGTHWSEHRGARPSPRFALVVPTTDNPDESYDEDRAARDDALANGSRITSASLRFPG